MDTGERDAEAAPARQAMQAISIVFATTATGRRLAGLMRVARELSAVGGAPSVVVAYGRAARTREPIDRGDVHVVVHAADDRPGAALLAGARHAQAERCLLVDDELQLDEAIIRAHRLGQPDGDVVTIGCVTPGLPDGGLVTGTPDPLLAFAMQGGRNACLPRAPLLRLAGDQGLDEPVAAYRIAQQLRAHGIPLVCVEGAAVRELPSAARARARGRAAARLYAEDPATLQQSGLGRFKQGSLRQIMLRRALVGVPGVARGIHLFASAIPGSALRAELRLLTSDALFWRTARSLIDRETWGRMKSDVTILMYHAFATEGEAASWYVLPGRRLARQLLALRLLRRRVLPLDAYIELRESHRLPPPRTVVITIDDGYEDVYRVAAPILAAHRCPATVFAVSSQVGQRASWTADGPLHDRPLASWQQLRDGLSAGLDVGAHSRTHPRLTELTDEAAAEEIAGSRRELAEGLQRPVRFFAYPHGAEDAGICRLVADAGFAAACSSRGGRNGPTEPLTRLRRVEIRGNQGVLRFVCAVFLGRRHLMTRARRAGE
jgi:peptidoglycan/xylan/chitin deacetylase (PgdA/CDA1 family)